MGQPRIAGNGKESIFGKMLFDVFMEMDVSTIHPFNDWDELPDQDKKQWSELAMEFLGTIDWYENGEENK